MWKDDVEIFIKSPWPTEEEKLEPTALNETLGDPPPSGRVNPKMGLPSLCRRPHLAGAAPPSASTIVGLKSSPGPRGDSSRDPQRPQSGWRRSTGPVHPPRTRLRGSRTEPVRGGGGRPRGRCRCPGSRARGRRPGRSGAPRCGPAQRRLLWGFAIIIMISIIIIITFIIPILLLVFLILWLSLLISLSLLLLL